MPSRIKEGKTLLKGQRCTFNRGDDQPSILNTNPDPLIDMEMGGTRHCDRQSNTEIISPFFQIKKRFHLGHDGTPFFSFKQCLNERALTVNQK